jgi:hypothetical protein
MMRINEFIKSGREEPELVATYRLDAGYLTAQKAHDSLATLNQNAATRLLLVWVGSLGEKFSLSQSTNSLRRTDAKREYRFYLREILAHVNRQSLHKLFYHYASPAARAASASLNSRLLGSLAVYDPVLFTHACG